MARHRSRGELLEAVRVSPYLIVTPWRLRWFVRVSPNTNRPLPIECPKCHYDGCLLVVKSLTVMTVTCVHCRHTWATEMTSLPPDVQERIPKVLQDL